VFDAIKPHGIPQPDGLERGAARCPGPDVQTIVAADALKPPPVLSFQDYRFLGDGDVDFQRYYDRDFFAAEVEKIWGRCWQWVCREDHIPEAGDFYVYEIAHLSYIVVRQNDGGLKGFVNSCLHRGTKFKRAEGAGAADDIRCPFHGWTWSNDGRLKAAPCAWGCGKLRRERAREQAFRPRFLEPRRFPETRWSAEGPAKNRFYSSPALDHHSSYPVLQTRAQGRP